jgi:alkylation response protein AidB-like acyl-CoA dehydrogenase
VPAAAGADLLVLVTPDHGDGPEIHVVGGDGANVRPVSSLDPTRRLGVPEWVPGEATRLVSGPEARAAIDRTADRAAVATAAELLGLTDRMIAMAAGYAKERHQFGKPIGSFQAVKHLLAGARVLLEFARPVVYAAAWALDEAQPDASRAASVAKTYASDAATEAARVSLQVHGAIGYTWECDLQLFLKRAWALAGAWGSAADHRARVLESLVAGA